MRCEVVAVGTELLLGQIVDTNSSWIGQQLADIGINSHFQTKVGDNLDRIVLALRTALARSDAVIVCGGLGPTQDDITREAIADVMNVPLERDEAMVDTIAEMFMSRGRDFPMSNARQADKPVGAEFIVNPMGTAPGLICPVGLKVVYAVPGVPYEMEDMLQRVVLPDLQRRSGSVATIRSRVLRTWGMSESGLGELVDPLVRSLDERGPGAPTIAFLASGIEGIKIRITVKADTEEEAMASLAVEESELRALLGDIVFGVDDESMEYAVGVLLEKRAWTLATAESLTAGLIASRVGAVPQASGWYRGSVVSYASDIKYDLLGVPEGPVVSEEAAAAMAEGVRKLLGADCAVSTTGVAGPDRQEGQPVGTVFLGTSTPDGTEVVGLRMPGDRNRVRQFSSISALDLLRRRLMRG